MNTWDKLTQFEKAEVMKIALDNGIYNLDTIRNAYNEYAQGGSIHIDPSKKGTFTAAASKHNMGVQEFASKVLANKEDYSPAMVKKANFARNASKWHSYGGNLYDGTTENSQQMRNGKYFATNSRGDSYYLSPSALVSNEVNVTVPETFITANPDDVARGNAKKWWREHSNVWNEKPLQQVSPEFDAILMGPLVKEGLKYGVSKAVNTVENYRYPFGRPQIPENFLIIKPQVRTRIGDVEIDNPNLHYRQGGIDMLNDYLKTGVVRGKDSRDIWGALYANNPMFQKGSLFYNEKPALLVSNGKMSYADVLSRPISEEKASRFNINWTIPSEELNSSNTAAYTWKPGYGYKRTLPEDTPTIEWTEATAPKITVENAASITPEQWTTAQDAAIARGDMAEAQRLRDLHFRIYQNGDMVDVNGNPIHEYHGSPEENIIEFYKPNDPRLPAPKGINFKATGEEGIYTSPRKGYAANYMADLGGRYRVPLTKEQKALLKAGKTREEIGLPSIPKGRLYDLYSNTKLVPENLDIDFNQFTLSTKEANLIKSKGYTGFNIPGKKYPEHIVLEPNQLKLADAVTYDDNGVRIPLGERDNFKLNDIRYGLLPLGIGLAGYGLNQKRLGGRIRLSNGG